MTGHQKDILFVLTALHGRLSGNHQKQFQTIFGPKLCIFLHYAHITPNSWALVDPTQWDHNFPTSWGNSGSLWFSGRCPFNRLAGYYEALNSQNGSFWGQKMQFFGPKSMLWKHHPIFFDTIMARHKKYNFFVLTGLHGGPWGGRRGRKTAFLTPQKATLCNWGSKTARRAAERPPTRKPKVSRVTSGYGGDMIPSSRVRPSPKKGGYMGVAIKKADFWAENGPKMQFVGPK